MSSPDPFHLLANASPVILETLEKNEFKITPEELKKAITSKTKALIINSPSNPPGGRSFPIQPNWLITSWVSLRLQLSQALNLEQTHSKDFLMRHPWKVFERDWIGLRSP
jgi:hypothetical protein